MASTQEAKKATSTDPQKSHIESTAEVLKKTKVEDKSAYGSDPETERDVVDTQREIPNTEKDLPTGKERSPGQEDHFPSKQVA